MSRISRKQLAAMTWDALTAEFPDSQCSLDTDRPERLAIRGILSAQCTDVRVNLTAKELFAKYPEPADIAAADIEDIARMIRPVGLTGSKSRSVKAFAEKLTGEWGGVIPNDVPALMEIPVKFIWTHDAFRVGEDGPTHEPVEQEAQIRLMEKLKNHHGRNSVLVLRPADAKETTEAWKIAMENTTTPTALLFSRQNIANLPEGNDYSQVAKGGYIVAGSDENPDVILVASGSEVSTLEAGAKLLRADGKKVRVVSVPSEGLFRQQSKEYQQSVLPTGVKKFGMTAGLPVTLQGLVPESEGTIWGMESFGFSAPYKVLDEKLGYTAQNVYEQVNKLF